MFLEKLFEIIVREDQVILRLIPYNTVDLS